MMTLQRNLSWLMLLLVAGCASMESVTPTTFNQQLAIGYATTTQVRETTTTLLRAGKIKADDAQNVQMQADHVRAGLDIARAVANVDRDTGIMRGDAVGAMAKLRAATAALSALQTYLSSRGN